MAIKSFSNIIKELREQKNFTQKMVEELTGIDRTTISAYEKGKRVPSIDIACKLADLYRVSLDELFGRDR